MRGNETPARIVTNFCTGVRVHDVITSANFHDCRLWGLIDLHRRPYNTLALLCECVIMRRQLPCDILLSEIVHIMLLDDEKHVSYVQLFR